MLAFSLYIKSSLLLLVINVSAVDVWAGIGVASVELCCVEDECDGTDLMPGISTLFLTQFQAV